MNISYIQDSRIRKRLFWLQEAHRLGVNRACLRLGIYKSHFYYWKRRFDGLGIDGLANRSKRPKRMPRLSDSALVQKVLAVREDTDRGADTIALLLWQKHRLKVHRSTVHKILKREGKIIKPEKKPKKKHKLRYQSSHPGDRIQIDVKYVPYKIQDGTWNGRAYQYTAIDDCTRVRFAQILPGHGIPYLNDFLHDMIRFFPFKVKLIQTDNHVIFTYKFTAHKQAFKKKPKTHFLEIFCKENGMKHHLIEPGEPALNGKVERSHRTDQSHFYDWHYFKQMKPLQNKFSVWIDFYNHQRPHWALAGQTPAQRLKTLGYKLRRISHEENSTYSLAA